MKKKFLLLPVMMLALAACNSGTSEPVSETPASAEPTTSVSEPVSTEPVPEYISAAALKSLMGSITIDGTLTSDYGDDDVEETPFILELAEDAIEVMYEDYYGDVVDNKYFNVDGKVAKYIHDADNVIKPQFFLDDDGEEIEYPFSVLTQASYVSVSNIEKTAEGTYTVNSQDLRDAVASAVAAYMFDSESASVVSMELGVEDDKVTSVKFQTNEYTVKGYYSTYTVTDTYELNLSRHGETTVEHGLEAYETYEEAAALNEAFAKLSQNVTAHLVTTTDDEVTLEADVYFVEGLNYFDVTSYSKKEVVVEPEEPVVPEEPEQPEEPITRDPASVEESETSTSVEEPVAPEEPEQPQTEIITVAENEKFGYVAYPEINGSMEFTVEDGKIVAQAPSAEAIGEYPLSFVAAEMFEYKDGKYVTRNATDAATVAQYVLLTNDQPEQLVVEILEDGSLKFSYEAETYEIDREANDIIYHTEVNEMTLVANEEKVTPIDAELTVFKGLLTSFAALPEDMMLPWSNTVAGHAVTVTYGLVVVDGKTLAVTEVGENYVAGTIGEHEVKVMYVAAESEDSQDVVGLYIDEDSPIVLTIDALNYYGQYLGFPELSALSGLELGYLDDDYLSSGMVTFGYFGENATEDYLAAYAKELVAAGYYDISKLPSSQLFTNGSEDETIAEYMGVEVVLIETNDYYGLVMLSVEDFTVGSETVTNEETGEEEEVPVTEPGLVITLYY